jgi:hypothetical protein
MNKEKIKETLFSINSQIINDLKERITSNKEQVKIDHNDTIDREDYSHQNESSEMDELLLIQLEKALAEKSKLETIDFHFKNKIEVGAVVSTNQFTFVIGVATIPFQVENKQYVGISIDAPIYSMMKDKVEGESFQYGNNHYQIVSIN